MSSTDHSLTYAGVGVDDDAARRFVERIGPIAKTTHGPQVLGGVGAFAGLFALGGDYRDPVLVSSTDSVGTKVKIASLVGRYRGLGVDLVNQSVNDVGALGAQPLFFLDYLASATLDDDAKTELVEGVAEACREAGCALIGGETATMPDIYAPGDFDFVGFVVGVVERDAIIDGARIVEGDALLALPSSGLHTNGFSLARRALGVGVGGDAAAERARLERYEPDLGMTLAEALLASHRSYVLELTPLLPKIKGIAHITGGGAIAGNVARILPPAPSTSSGQGLGARIDRAAWTPPAIFGFIQRAGGIADAELWSTFNMGLGVIFAVDPSDVAAVRASLPEAVVVGAVVAGGGVELT
jgi:phosphoribosylformylglycinamidine cyclo-ligase